MTEERPMRVYIVEDNAILQSRLKEAFSDIPGVQVVGEAVDAASAIKDIDALAPHLVTLDLWLKAGSGFDVLRWLGSSQAARKPECIVLTSHTDFMHREEAARLGAAQYLDKARDMPALIELIAEKARTMA